MGSGIEAPIAADFGGAAAPNTVPLAAGASAAVPNPAAGFAGGFPASTDALTASAPSILAGGDMLAQGATPGADPFAAVDTASGWGGYAAPGVAPIGAAPPAYGAADPTAPAPTAQEGLDYIYSQPGLGPYDPNTAATQDAWANAMKTGTYTPTPAGAAPSAFDSATKGLSSALSSPWTKVGLAAAPLAIGLSGIGTSLPASAQAAQANATALAAQGGNLNPAQNAVLAQTRQNLTNQWKQTLYNMGVQAGKGGVPMSTQWPQIQASIDQQVALQAQTMIQDNIKNALAGDQQLISLAQLQMQQDRNFQQTLMNVTRALGTAAGLGGQTRTVTTTTTSPTDTSAAAA